MSFLIYAAAAAWQDGKRRMVSGWLFLFFFSHFLASQICRMVFDVDMGKFPAVWWYRGMPEEVNIWLFAAGAMIGGVLLLIGRMTQGALGDGDGIFFLISGMYLGFWKNLLLLFSALLLCSFVGLFLMVWGRFKGKDYRKAKLPFLVFVLPVGMILAWK